MKKKLFATLFYVLFMTIFCYAQSGKIYHLDRNEGVFTTDLTGGLKNLLVTYTGSSSSTAQDVEIDKANNHMYVLDRNAKELRRYSLSGGNNTLIYSYSNSPTDIELDLINSKIFHVVAGEVFKTNLLGNTKTSLISYTPGPSNLINQIELDISNNHMYLINSNAEELRRYNLSGGSNTLLFTYTDGNPRDFALDISGAKIYHINFVGPSGEIFTTNLTGGSKTILTTFTGSSSLLYDDIELDIANDHMYILDRNGDALLRFNTNGNSQTTIYSYTGSNPLPWDIILDISAPSNTVPLDITLSTNTINESLTGVNAVVGNLSTTDADVGDSHTYTLVSGSGDTDNGSFNIDNSTDELRTNGSLSAGSYSIRINTNDGTDDYAEQFTITVSDDVSPVVTSVSVPISGTYVLNENLDFTVNFDENVTVVGTPQIALTIGSTSSQATYQSGSGTQNLVFRYTVQNGDVDVDGIAVGTLSASGGTLQDAANNNANLTLNSVGSTSNVNVLATDVTYASGSFSPTDPSGLDLSNYDLEVQDGTAVISSATTFDNVIVEPDAVLDLDADLTVNNELLFQSDASGAGQLADATGVSITGNVTVERYITSKRAFRFLSSSVTTTDFIFENWQISGGNTPLRGTHITGPSANPATNGLDDTATNNPSMFTFDNTATGAQGGSAGAWEAVTNTRTTSLEQGVPYLLMVRGDRTIDLTNNNATPTQTTLSATGELFAGTSILDATLGDQELSNQPTYFSLVANPYQAVVDLNQVARNNVTNFFYVWDASIGGSSGYGGYVTYDFGTGLNNVIGSDVNQYIAPGMSFFIQNDNSSSPEIIFEEQDKATNQAEVTIFNDNPYFYINMGLYSSADFQNGSTVKDAVLMVFSQNYTTEGSSEDADKLFNFGDNIAIVNNGLKSIDLQNVPLVGHEIELNVSNYTESNYTFYFDVENKPEDLEVFLVDNFLNTETKIFDNFPLDFTVDTSIPSSSVENRFNLIFKNTTLGVEENIFGSGFSLYPNPTQDANFSIRSPGLKNDVVIEIRNLLGQQVLLENITVEEEEVKVNAENLSTGVYLIKLSQDNKVFTEKLIVK